MGGPTNTSTLKEFLASIAAIRGDLSNITAPPFVLATKSVVELPGFWAERPSFFIAPAAPSDPAERALAVLRWFLVSLKNQQYAGRAEEDGVRKPLNAFLGECFLAKWEDDGGGESGGSGETVLVAEQVSHHPPVTACRLQNEKHGVYAEGFTRQEITLSLGNVSIKQTGHALLTLRKHDDETYLIPLPGVKVKGLLSGLSGTYPELEGTYTIPSTNGHYSVIDFSGQSLLGSSKKHEFVAKLFAPGQPEEEPLYTVKGHWHTDFTIYKGAECDESTKVETLVLNDLSTSPMKLLEEDGEAQDPWETRRAWKGVREALERGDMAGTVKAKSIIEQGQREMRKDEKSTGKQWQPLFFKPHTEDAVASSLYRSILQDLKPEATVAIWKFDEDLWKAGVKRPFHGTLTPDNKNRLQGERNGTRQLMNGVKSGSGDVDDDQASLASFKTANEFPVQCPLNGAGSKTAGNMAPPATPNSRQSIEPSSSGGLTKFPGQSSLNGDGPRTAVNLKLAPPATPNSRQSVEPGSRGGLTNEFPVQSPLIGDGRKTAVNLVPPAIPNSRPNSEHGSSGGLTPSGASVSPSMRRGKRAKAKASIGKFKTSLSSSLSKLGSSPARSNGGSIPGGFGKKGSRDADS